MAVLYAIRVRTRPVPTGGIGRILPALAGFMLIAAAFLAFLAACGTESGDFSVARVIDGDTIEVQSSIGVRYRVRYIGIDAPETYPRSECYGPEATAKNRELLEGKKVTLDKDVSETDKYGRILRYVFVDSLFVNAELVKGGYTRAANYPPDVKYRDLFAQLEKEARERKQGLWGPECQQPSRR